MFRRTRNCCCMNNNMDTDCNNTENILEDTCNNVISYSNDDMYDSCNCGFDEETNLFPELVSPYFPGQSMEEINFIEKTNEIGKGCNKCC